MSSGQKPLFYHCFINLTLATVPRLINKRGMDYCLQRTDDPRHRLCCVNKMGIEPLIIYGVIAALAVGFQRTPQQNGNRSGL